MKLPRDLSGADLIKPKTLPGCQRKLREALSDWLALRLRMGEAHTYYAPLPPAHSAIHRIGGAGGGLAGG